MRYYIFESLGAWNEFLALHPVGRFFPPLLSGTFLARTFPSWVPDLSKACIAPAFLPEFGVLAIPRDSTEISDCLLRCLVPSTEFRCKLHYWSLIIFHHHRHFGPQEFHWAEKKWIRIFSRQRATLARGNPHFEIYCWNIIFDGGLTAVSRYDQLRPSDSFNLSESL